MITLARLIHQCSTLLNAGMGLLPALRTLSSQQDDPALSVVLPAICAKVESGHGLARCMADYPGVFNNATVFLVRAGEESGRMDSLFERLAAWLEKDSQVWQRTRQAMVYPATVLATAVLLGWLLFTFFLPPFFEAFTSSGEALPLLTQIVLLATRVVGHPLSWLTGLLGLWAFRRAFWSLWLNPQRKTRFFLVLRSIPVLGKAVRLTATVRMANCLSVLLDCGLPLVRSWGLAAAASGDAALEADSKRVLEEIRQGETLAHALGDHPLYPRGFSSMLGAAEEAAAIPATLNSLAQVYDQEVEYVIQTLSVLFEPIFIAGLALIVVVILLAVLLPLYGTLNQLG
ncbi:type II secretion system F family protein [bacterium]|nr:type II secretion system F family protein [bacterium]